MKKQEKICLSCQHYHLVNEEVGKCRVDRGRIDKHEYPVKQHGDTCRKWLDGGQQYYIRVGWIKSKKGQATQS